MTITCVCLSKEPKTFPDLPEHIKYINHISTISNHAELHEQRLAALEKVETETFFFQDDDDPLPNKYVEVESGIVYGDFIRLTTIYDFEEREPAFEWSNFKHLANPCVIHRAFCNTQQTKLIASLLPKGNYWTEILLYHTLASRFGFKVDKSLDMYWKVKPSGMHVAAFESVKQSVSWLMSNEHLLQKLL